MAAAAADAVKKATRRTYEGLMGQLEGWCHENQGRFPGIINADTNEIDIDDRCTRTATRRERLRALFGA